MKRKKQPKGLGRTDDDLKVIFQSNTRQTTLSDKSKKQSKPKFIITDALTGVKISEE